MSTAERKIDKSKWGPGPWHSEPDRWEGEHEGFPVLALRNQMGAWCGYIATPPGHPWHGAKGCAEYPDVDVHGGLTYGGSGNICHVPNPGEPDDVWWLGFDCSHLGDVSPEMDRHGYTEHGASYKSLDYVQAECRHLADQAKEAAK